MKKSRKQLAIEARKASDPIAQSLGRTDIDYESDELPTAPRVTVVGVDAQPRGAKFARVDPNAELVFDDMEDET